MSNERLSGKTALITGAGGEIGSAIARVYLAEGAQVIITGRTEQKLIATCKSIESENKANSDRISYVVLDNSKDSSLQRGIAEVSTKYGSLDILVNNAGIAGPQEEIANIPLESSTGSEDGSLHGAVGSLLLGPWLTTRTFLSLIRTGGSIINISTIFSRSPYYGRAAYVVPKATLNALTKAMAKEMGLDARRIRVNTIYPGPVDTDRILRVFGAMDNLRSAPAGTTRDGVIDRMIIKEAIDGRKWIPKEDVAQTALFLATDESLSFTAHDFEVTRGFRTDDSSISNLATIPRVSSVALAGRMTWIVGGSNFDDAVEFAEKLQKTDSEVFVTFRDSTSVSNANARLSSYEGIKVSQWDPAHPTEWNELFRTLRTFPASNWSVVVMPMDEVRWGSQVLDIEPSKIREFVEGEIELTIVVAKRLEELFKHFDQRMLSEPTVVFLTDRHDGNGNVFSKLKRAATNQLIRTWRHENDISVNRGIRVRRVRVNQLVRYENAMAGNWAVCMNWIISLSGGMHLMGAIDLILDPSLDGFNSPFCVLQESSAPNFVRNLHLDRVALITGGSEGIGGAISRLLALSGARVAIAERSKEKLLKIRDRLVSELRELNFPDPEGRILMMPSHDVTLLDSFSSTVDQVIAKFGRIDFLINNAGLVGAEQMAVDIPPETWQETLTGNLVSNYLLILSALPHMKKQRYGHIINMSSYFGGSRHGTVPYTNRSDYAVSKAGQIALVEALAETLGPEIQINAIAPGPVDGGRLNGTMGRPGLFQRRARLIRDNIRLNSVYSALHAAIRGGHTIPELTPLIAENSVVKTMKNASAPTTLTRLATEIFQSQDLAGFPAQSHFLTHLELRKLIDRMHKLGISISSQDILRHFVEPSEPFYPPDLISNESTALRQRMTSLLAMKRMPTDLDLASEMVSALAHRTMTGEVLYPSCGFRCPGHVLGDSFGYEPAINLNGQMAAHAPARLAGSTVFIFGDSMFEEMAQLAIRYGKNCRVVIVTFSREGFSEINRRIHFLKSNDGIRVLCEESRSVDKAFEAALHASGPPCTIVSFPLGDLPPLKQEKFNTETVMLPSIEGFRRFIESNIGNHFYVARRASLIDFCHTVFVTHSTTSQTTKENRAWARFAKNTLQPFTVAIGKESMHLPHRPVFFQVSCEIADDNFFNLILSVSGATTETVSSSTVKASA